MTYCLNPTCPQPQNTIDSHFCTACGTSLILDDKYRAISLLGKGGFGRTLLAEVVLVESAAQPKQPSTSPQRCVIKQAYGHQSRFEQEAERLRELGKHPQIPQLYAAVENELGQFLVQEYAPGETLAQIVEREGTFSEEQVRSLLKSLVAVLQYVHSFQIIHRDIKPENIVARPGDDPMLVDFGAAKWVRHTSAKTVIGSAGYAAPEQSMGQATFASDIYSVGLTCLHLLTGMHPFALYSAADDRWVWQDYLPTPISKGFAQVLTRMVARSLQQRYENMAQVEQAISSLDNPVLRASQQILARAQSVIPSLKEAMPLGPKTESEIAIAPQKSEPQKWAPQYRITNSTGRTQAIACSPNGHLFATGGSDASISLWQLDTGQLIQTFSRRRWRGNGHSDAIVALHFHPDSRILYSASSDGTFKEWDCAALQLLNTIATGGWAPTDLLVTSDGKQIICANQDGQIGVWDIATLMPFAQLTQHQRQVNAIALSPYANLLASASNDGTIKLWRREANEKSRTQSPSNPQLAKTLSLSASKAGRRFSAQQLLSQTSPIAVKFVRSPTRPYELVVATNDNQVLWCSFNPKLMEIDRELLVRSESQINAIALSSNDLLAVGTEDSRVTLWDIKTNSCVAELRHDWGVVSLAFGPQGRSLVVASADEVITIWQRVG